MGNIFVPGYPAGQNPSYRTLTAPAARQIFRSMNKYDVIQTPMVALGSLCYDGTNTGREREIRAGHIWGQVTAAPGVVIPLRRTRITTAAATASSLTVAKPGNFIQGETVAASNAPGSTVTISTINYTNGAITLSGNLTWTTGAHLIGAGAALAGAETALFINDKTVRVWRDHMTDVVDIHDLVKVNSGEFESSMILNDLTAMLADQASCMRMRNCEFYSDNRILAMTA